MAEDDNQALYEPIGRRFLESIGALEGDESPVAGDVAEPEAAASLAEISEQLGDDLGDRIDEDLLDENVDRLARDLGRIPSLVEGDLTEDLEPAFEEIAEPAWEITSHLASIDFFENARRTLPAFDPAFITDSSVQTLYSVYIEGRDRRLANALEAADARSDLSTWLLDVMRRSEEVETNLRVEVDKPKISPMTLEGSSVGAVLWIEDLGRHLWMSEVLLTEEMIDRGATHARAMGTGLAMTAQGAAELGDNDAISEDAIAKITAGFAVTHLHQLDLPYNVYWITDEMRAPAQWASA